jgi:transcriptional regulator with XRE-family HTH domain
MRFLEDSTSETVSEDHNMDRPGEKLRRVRERLKLTYRDVEQASQEIAARRGNPDFTISLSRLADIENNGRTPTIFRSYSLSAIYHLNLHELLDWYGVPVGLLTEEALQIKLAETHQLAVTPNGHGVAACESQGDINLNKTTYLNQLIRQWGKAPIHIMEGADQRVHRYGLVGLDDWSMFPILRPGSLVLIDESRRKIARGGWTGEFDRPIYFLEHRDGYLCGWCAVGSGRLFVLPHPASEKCPLVFNYPGDIDVIGQVTGVVMLFDPAKKRPAAQPRIDPASPRPRGTLRVV